MTRIIKRYANRKMYDTEASRYVTLDGVTDLVRAGEDLRIVDNDNGEDLTALTFAQIILEEEKRKRGLLDLPFLRWIIREGGSTLQELLHGVEQRVERGREAIEEVRELAEDRVQRVRDFMHRADEAGGDGDPAADDGASKGKGLLTDLLELPQRQLEQIQRGIDAQVRSSVDAITKHPALRKEIDRLEDSIRRIEERLGLAATRSLKKKAAAKRKRRSSRVG